MSDSSCWFVNQSDCKSRLDQIVSGEVYWTQLPTRHKRCQEIGGLVIAPEYYYSQQKKGNKIRLSQRAGASVNFIERGKEDEARSMNEIHVGG